MSEKKVAIVAGAAGIIGRNLIQYLSEVITRILCEIIFTSLQKRPDFVEIIGLSRRAPDYKSRQKHVAADLLNAIDTENKLKDFTNVTHIFFAAYQEKPSLAEQVNIREFYRSWGELHPQLSDIIIIFVPLPSVTDNYPDSSQSCHVEELGRRC